MSGLNLQTGVQSGAANPLGWDGANRIAKLARDQAGVSSLDLRFAERFFYKQDVATDGADSLYQALETMDATCVRGSKGWYAKWDQTNGGVCGRLTEYGVNAVRYGSQGLLEETSSTNEHRNPRCEGAKEGLLSGVGQLPTHWVTGGFVDSEWTITKTGYENGWPYIELAYDGSDPAADLFFESSSQIAASDGEDWCASVGVRLMSGDLDDTTIKIRYQDIDDGVQLGVDNLNIAPDGQHRRFFFARTASGGAGQTHIRAALQFVHAAATTYTIRIYAPQLEQASAPSTPILPEIGTPAATTRATETVTALASCTRASRKSNAGEWDFTNGGAVGAYREYLDNVPAITGKGLLVEESSTNEIRNPRCKGSGGTGGAPNNVSVANPGLTATYEPVVVNGWPGVRITLSGTGSGTYQYLWDGTAYLSASSGQTWTHSVGVVLESGNFPDDFDLILQERNSGGSLLASELDVLSVDGSHRRFHQTRTLSEATTAILSAGFRFATTGATSCTFIIFAPQLEQKAYPTSPILPPKGAPGAATRAKDQISVDLGQWHNDGSGQTLYAEVQRGANDDGYIADLVKDGSDRIDLRLLSGNLRADIASSLGGGDDAAQTVATLAAGATGRIAVAFAEDDAAFSASGGTQATDSFVDIPDTPTQLTIGGALTSPVAQANCYIKQIRYFPTRKTNAELEALVGNS